jgi:small-conductance mechanosensitive channel
MLSDILQKSFLQNQIIDYLTVLGTFLAGIVIIQMLKGIIISRLKAWAKKTATTIDDFLLRIIEKKLIPLLYIGAFYLSLNNLAIPSTVSRILDVSYAVIFTYVGLHLAVEVMNYSLERYWVRREVDTSRQGSLKGLITILKVIIWGVGITFLLDNLGFEISAVVAGLGIGGIAVALAAQTILGDLFSYFVIFFDRPFEIGDFIIVDDYMGSIEYIGIKTTRVRSLGGEQLVFSNTDLTNARVRNYKRMQKRRIVFKLGVVYQTSSAQIKEIPGIIKSVIEHVDNTAFDRSHFASYGDFSLDFETVYYVLSGNYNTYMDIQQEINFAIKDEFEKLGIEFAFPTQTLFVEKTQEKSTQ